MFRWSTLLFALLSALAGCDRPSDGFAVAPVQRVFVAGDTYDVRQVGLRAEAIRVNSRFVPNRAEIERTAGRAISAATGGHVLAMTGDQAMIHALLNCEGATGPILVVAPFSALSRL
ncbi:hypothetical protein ACM25N_01410 [Roseovarius sp. C7]|uniref:hypothetical protein n=1 Tax=Roseovarius sp. C7 TaxID=3398643 RepID=UPI0039F53DB7